MEFLQMLFGYVDSLTWGWALIPILVVFGVFITIMSGWTGMPIATFVATSILARATRFFAVAVLLRVFGSPIRDFIEQRLGLVFTLLVVLFFGGFLAVRYL